MKMGVIIKAINGFRTLKLCDKHYKKEKGNVELAIQRKLVQRPIMGRIEHCDFCE